MEILKYPHPSLKTKCEEIKVFDRIIEHYVEEMKKVMESAGGIGLAANQVGINARIMVMIPIVGEMKMSPMTLINPVIIERSSELANLEEGCLSAPGKKAVISSRANNIKVKYKNVFGLELIQEFSGINAVCIQHEVDHLNGIFFLDREN